MPVRQASSGKCSESSQFPPDILQWCDWITVYAGNYGLYAAAFAAFEAERRPNALAVQRMALDNYIEMRDRVDDADYLLQRALERILAERHPDRFVPRYTMVSFRRVPYATALERGLLQRELLAEATRGRARIDQIDLALADRLVHERLAPLQHHM